ncbi:MAG: hypothetical protein PSY12_13305 [bacterium]|nr:hypothetical protein [bacterium]
MRMLFLLLMLTACSKGTDVMEELPNSSLAGAPREERSESRMEAALARPVTIGEDGPRLDACGAMGQAVRVGARGLIVRAAPFAEAREVARMAEGDRAHVCARTIDQKWLGVIVLPPPVDPAAGNGAEAVDCGVSEPVDRKQPYHGPCVSGWVASAAIRLIAG